MIYLCIAVVFLSICMMMQSKKIARLEDMLMSKLYEVQYKVTSEITNGGLENSKKIYETMHDLHRDLKIELLTIQKDMARPISPVEKSYASKKEEPPANRKPRTEEQRLQASEKRKQWWAEKKAKNQLAAIMKDELLEV